VQYFSSVEANRIKKNRILNDLRSLGKKRICAGIPIHPRHFKYRRQIELRPKTVMSQVYATSRRATGSLCYFQPIAMHLLILCVV